MPVDRKTQVVLVETLIAGGLWAIGMYTGHDPAQSAAVAVTVSKAAPLIEAAHDVGINWISSLTERGVNFFGKLWIGRQGVQHDALAAALGNAFRLEVEQIEDDWCDSPEYARLKLVNPEQAKETISGLRELRRQAAFLFSQPTTNLAGVLNQPQTAAIMAQDEAAARRTVIEALGKFFWGYDDQFVTFIQKRATGLVDSWLLRFVKELRDPEHGASAWVAYQQLCFASLAAAVADLQQTLTRNQALDAEIRAYVAEIQQWTEQQEQLSPEERNPLSAQTLLKLEEVSATLSSVEAGVGRVEAGIERVEDTVNAILQQVVPPAATGGFRDPLIVRELFGGAVRLVNLRTTRSATPEEVAGYYRGAPLTWNVIQAHADAQRDQYEGLLQQLLAANDRTRLFCLVGEPGSGKTSLAWRLAADYTEATDQPLLEVLDNQAGDVWYNLESGMLRFDGPLCVLVDDMFRSEDSVSAMTRLNPDLPVTIIASTRANEKPDYIRVPFYWKMFKLDPPSSAEKLRAAQQVKPHTKTLSQTQQERLDRANSWLVMMIELVTGNELGKIVRETVKRLKRDDEIVYRAYEYLCFVGQYDLDIPNTLLVNMDSRRAFFEIWTRPAARGLIFKSVRAAKAVRVLHSIVAKEALSVYHRDPAAIASELFDHVDSSVAGDRLFVPDLLHQMLLVGNRDLVTHLLQHKEILVTSLVESSGPHELIDRWVPFYRALGNGRKAEELTLAAISRRPESASDSMLQLALVEQSGTPEQIAAVVDATADWLGHNPQDFHVRNSYLALVEQRGTPKQVSAAIAAIAGWLDKSPQNRHVLYRYLGVVKSRGTPEQVTAASVATADWLEQNPQDATLRATFLGLVEHRGKPGQIALVIDATAAWLAQNPQDKWVRTGYLGLVERRGTPEQVAAVIDDTAVWLGHNPRDIHVRNAYLGLVERRGTPEQVAAIIDAIATWLGHNPQDATVRNTYLGLVERRGTPEQITALIGATAVWLGNNPQNTYARNTYLGLVERRGTPEQVVALIDATARWLGHNPQDATVRNTYLGLVERRGTPEQITELIGVTAAWLDQNPQDMYVHNRYIGIVERRGTPKQVAAVIDGIAAWLDHNLQDTNVRSRYLAFLERRGTPKQVAAVINGTTAWLDINPLDTNVRLRYLVLVERRGTPEQVAAVIEATTAWLDQNSQDAHVRSKHLGFVEHRGTDEQAEALIDVTAAWLDHNPQDATVRSAYLGLVEHRGTPEQIATLIDDTATWLDQNPHDTYVHNIYLGLVERRGTLEQKAALIDATTAWLDRTPHDTNVRSRYLGLVEHCGTPRQIAAVINKTAVWLDHTPHDTTVRLRYLGLVERCGKPEQVAILLDATATWLDQNPQDANVFRIYLRLVEQYGTLEQLQVSYIRVEEWLARNQNCRYWDTLEQCGSLLCKLGRIDEANDVFRRVIKLHPGHVGCRIKLAWSLHHQSYKQEALQQLKQARWWAKRIHPDAENLILYHLGRYYLLEGSTALAISYLRGSIEGGPSDYKPYFDFGRALLMNGQYSEALKTLQEARQRLPSEQDNDNLNELNDLIAQANAGLATSR
ncbi:MAG: hypothetical protein U0X20_29825 [Caldilineaceae bacterium]